LTSIELTHIAGAGAIAGLAGYMILYEPYQIQVRELELTFPNLPDAFDGYTIRHLADLHMRRFDRLERRLVKLISGREVDTCFITGDVTFEPRASDTFRRVCSHIRHRDPIYMVLGNSEHKPWLDTPTLLEALSFEGLVMLINSSTTIERAGQSVRIAGVDDPYTRRHDVEKAFEGVDPNEFIIYLTHCPSTTPYGISRGADLVLAGHTHGGQVRLPFTRRYWTHMRENKALNDGLYIPDDLSRLLRVDVGGSTLFVTRGVGMSRLRIRFLCKPEIAYITLRRSG